MSSTVISNPTVNIWHTYVQEKAGPEAAGRREAGGGGGRQGTFITLISKVIKVSLSGMRDFFLHQYPYPGPGFSVADPDQYVFGPPGSGSSFMQK